MSSESAIPIADLAAAPRVYPRLNTVGLVLAAVGLLLSGAALATDAVRFQFAYLLGFAFVWTVVLGCLFFVGLQHVSNSVWSIAVRRVAEMFAAPMWMIAVLFVPLVVMLALGRTDLFPWADTAAVEGDHLLEGKQPYLNVPFFTARAVVFFGLWIGFAGYYVRTSLKQDRGEAGVEASLRMRRVSAPFMLIYAVTATFAGIDWLMSLDPYWYSTIFGVYVFSGMVVTALAVITIAVVLLRDSGRLSTELVTEYHLYTLGALLFGFVCFWAYIAFSQYMLIWYANLPEESFYLVERLSGGWLGVSVALAAVRFVVPFLLLLSRRAKTNPRMLLWVSVLMVVGQLLDLYWLIMPENPAGGPVAGWQESGPVLLMSGLLIVYVARFLSKHAPAAIGDPRLETSRQCRL